MLTENGEMSEVTEAAERTAIFRVWRRPKALILRAHSFTEKQHRGLLGNALLLWFSSVKLCALCGKGLVFPEPSTELLGHQFIYQLRVGLAF